MSSDEGKLRELLPADLLREFVTSRPTLKEGLEKVL